MIGDGACQHECLTEACGNDAGDCNSSLCSAGCYPYMIDDGKCEEDCYVESCLWDGNDCDCSPGCTRVLLSNDQCDALCNNATCGFDGGRCAIECSPGCSEDMRGDGVCDAECLTAACERDNGDCECAPGCKYSDVGQCKPECQVPECNYDMVDPAGLLCSGSPPQVDCSAVECFDMWGDATANCDFSCEQCGMEMQYKLNCCDGCCSENYSPHAQFPSVCVRAPDRTTAQRPRVISVGEGGEVDSLSAAFSSIFEKHVEVRLLAAALTLAPSKYFIGYLDDFSPKYAQQVEALQSLKVVSQSCVESPGACEPSKIVIAEDQNFPFFNFAGSRYLEVSNIDFISTQAPNLCVGDLMSCMSLIDLFFIRDGMTVRFVNVTFRDFKRSVTSIISVRNATLVLENVEFIGITMHANKRERGVITLESAQATYTNGTISLTNNLWDYGLLDEGLGALSVIGGSLAVSGVRFTNNFMALAKEKSQQASLVHLRDCWKVVITGCDFAYNVGRVGAVISIYTLAWNVTSRYYETAVEMLSRRIEVSNCTFRNNTGTVGSSIYVHYLAGSQEVLIANCTFLSEFAETNSVIVGYSRLPTSVGESKTRTAITRNGAVRAVQYPVPRLTIVNSHFRNCNVGLFGLIALHNIWSARIEGITVEEPEASDTRNVSTNSLNVLLTIPGTRLPSYIPSSVPRQCQSLFNITSVAHLEIENVTVSHSRCRNVVTAAASSISVNTAYFGWNRGTASAGFVLFATGRSVTLHDCVFEGNENVSPFSKGAVYLTGGNVTISNCRFTFNAARQGAGVFLDSVQSAELRECSFLHNAADLGGAVFFTGKGSMSFSAVRSVFRNNSAVSYGGAICIAAESEQFSLKVTYDDLVFEKCRSTTGSAIFVSDNIILLPGSQCQRCKFAENASVQYGTMVFELVSGEMNLISSQFERNTGTSASALYAAFSRSQSAHLLRLTDTLFADNEARTTVAITTFSPLEIVATTVTCRGNVGSCLSLESASFACSHCEFVGNLAAFGAALQFYLSQADCADCEFDSNAAEFAGGAVLVKSYSAFSCHRCNFLNNTSQWQGGAVFVGHQSSVSLHSVAFTQNTARSGGFAVFLVLSDIPSVVRSSHFHRNDGTNYGCINLISAILQLEECDFTENSSTDSMGGLMLSQSVASIESCSFTNQTGVLGVFIYAISSNLTMSKSLLSNGVATNAGAGLALASSQAHISLCTFEALLSHFGGGITAQDTSNLIIDSCTFSKIYSKAMNRGVLTVFHSSLSLSNSALSSYDQGGVYGLQARITVSNSSFFNGTGNLGGGVACKRCTLAAIESCSFEALAADQGAGVYLEGSSAADSFRLADCEFVFCRGSLSGAAHIEEFPGSIANCVFLSNAGDRGGAIRLAASSQHSTAVTITANRFHRNSAVRGGAICWEATQPLLQDNEFRDNTAVYGPDTASFPVKLAVKNSTLGNVTSGRIFAQPLVLRLLDVYGQVTGDDYESMAQLSAYGNNTAVAGEVRAQAQGGEFFFADCSLIAPPGTNTSIIVTTSAIAHENSAVIPVAVRYCVKGEYLAGNQCIPCPVGTYSLTNHSSCANCPSSALCFGNFTLTPKSGYWRSSADTDTFFKCPNAGACLGSDDGASLTGVCAEGYQGVKCQTCADGYYQWGSIYCSKCQSAAKRSGVHISVSIALIVAVGVLAWLALGPSAKLVFCIRIYLNYVQVVMLFRGSGLSWPREVRQVFNAYEVFGAFPAYIVSGNCVIDDYYGKLLAVSLTPPALVLLAFVIWGTVSLVRNSRRYLQSEFVSTVVVIGFVAYTSVLWTMLESFHCEEVNAGEYWLLEHNLRCWTPKHTKFSLGLALPGAILYGLILPALALAFLRREEQGSVRFRYATLGYTESRNYWEIVVLWWKGLVLVCFTVFFRISELFPSLSAFGTMVAVSGVLATRRHFQQREFDSLEVLAFTASAATMYVGLMVSTGVLDSSASTAPFGAILAVNVCFSCAFVWRASTALYRQIKATRRVANGDCSE